MERVNYFQQGGAAPQQDMKAQIIALVQAAMQGDQKATQQVNQIMEAAKAGDQQAMQIAQLMEQVIKELQGQAVSAKYGTKLSYLQSLKCGGKKKKKGGKVCPECDKSDSVSSSKGLVSKHQYGGNFYKKWSREGLKSSATHENGMLRLGGPNGVKFRYNGKTYNPGTQATQEVVNAANAYYNNPASPLKIVFGTQFGKNRGVKLGRAFDVNLPRVVNVAEQIVPIATVGNTVE